MKSIFPGLSLVCGTALLIAGNTTAGIVFAVLGFLGAVMGTAIRHQQEQEALKVINEFTEALKKNAISEDKTASMEAAISQLGGALGELFGALVSPGFNDPWGTNNGGNDSGNLPH